MELHEAHNYTLYKSNSVGITTETIFSFVAWSEDRKKLIVKLPNRRGTFSISANDCIIVDGIPRHHGFKRDFDVVTRDGSRSTNGNFALNLCHRSPEQFDEIITAKALLIGSFEVELYSIIGDAGMREEYPQLNIVISEGQITNIQKL